MDISIVGTGYVGLVTGVCLAEKGHRVTCVDIDQEKIDSINAGIPPIHEKGLTELLKKHIGKGFCATSDLRQAVLDSQVTMIAVGTPFDGKTIDLSYIRAAAKQVGNALADKTDYHVTIIKSTVVPGTTSKVVCPILEEASGKHLGKDFGVGMNPEFLSEGVAVSDFLSPDRIVLGGNDERSLAVLEKLYIPFDATIPRLRVNLSTAEMIKYAANSVLATTISYANEISDLCESLGGIDVTQVMQGVHLADYFNPSVNATDKTHGRITAPITSFLEAGCGFGGSCLPKDVKALIAHGQSQGVEMPLLQAVIEINENRPAAMIALLGRTFPTLTNVRVSVLGLAFKPDTDDIRLSPALALIDLLKGRGAVVTVHDPLVKVDADARFGPPVVFADSLEDAIENCQAAMIVTRWKDYTRLPGLLAEMTAPPLIVDGRRMLDCHRVPNYEGIGLSAAQDAS